MILIEELPQAMKRHLQRSGVLTLLVASAVALAACGGTDAGPGATTAVAAAEGKSIHRYYAVTQIVPDGQVGNTTEALSESGHVIGNYTPTGSPGSSRSFHWTAAGGLNDIPTLDGYFNPVLLSEVNDAGTVVGSSSFSNINGTLPFAWTASRGTIPLQSERPGRNITGSGLAINDAGVIAGFVPGWQAAYWPGIDAAPVLIPEASAAWGINNVGQIVGQTADQHPFQWSEAAGLRRIPLPEGAVAGIATKVSDSGYVAGMFSYSGESASRIDRPFVLAPDGAIHLIPVDMTATSASLRLSNGGAITTMTQVGGRPFYWTPTGGLQDILGAAGATGQSRAISPDGTVVGWFQASADVRQAAFAWNPTEGFVNLNDRIDPASGLHLDEAIAVTDSGLVLALADGALVLVSPTVQSTAPVSGAIEVSDPIAAGTAAPFTVSFTDPDTWDTHTAEWSWGDGATEAATVSFAEGKGTVTGVHAYAAAGLYQVTLTLRDAAGGTTQSTRQVVVYDPRAGYVAGAGFYTSPAGAYKAKPDSAGRAEFTFLARYVNQGQSPLGLTVFRFAAGQMNFISVRNDWLVVSGNRATFRGTGSVNGTAGHRFELTLIDVDGRGLHLRAQDRIRMKIWSPAGELVYDNQLDPAQQGTPDEGTRISGGVIEVVAR